MKGLPLSLIPMSLDQQSQPLRPWTDVTFGLGFLEVTSGWPVPSLHSWSSWGLWDHRAVRVLGGGGWWENWRIIWILDWLTLWLSFVSCISGLSCFSCVQLFCNPKDCSLPGSSIDGGSPGKSTGVGCHCLLQEAFPTQGSNWHLLCLLH